MIKDSAQLGSYLKSESVRFEARLCFNTHFDARNWELSWWRGSTLHQLDFQPLEGNMVSAIQLTDHFAALPHLLRWAHRVIPLFPYLARIERTDLGTMLFPLEEQRVSGLIRRSTAA